MPYNLNSLNLLTGTEIDTLCGYIYGLPEYQAGTMIFGKMFAELPRAEFSQDSAVRVLDYDVNYRFMEVADGGGGMQLVFLTRLNKATGYSGEVVLRPVGEGFYAFPELVQRGLSSDLVLRLVKLV